MDAKYGIIWVCVWVGFFFWGGGGGGGQGWCSNRVQGPNRVCLWKSIRKG